MNFRAWNSDKLIVISSPKVASSYLDSKFYETPGNKNMFSIANDLELKLDINSISSESVVKDLELISTNKNKKDILIVYRNPLEKFLSGTIQDFANIITYGLPYNNFLIDYLLTESSIETNYIFKSKDTIFNNIQNINTPKEDEKFKKYYLELLRIYVNFYINNTITSDHATSNLYLLYPFINEKIVDKNKIKFFDIDSTSDVTLEDILLKYEITSKRKEVRNSQKKNSELLSKMISNDSDLMSKLHHNLKQETFFYNLLKNSKYNITSI